MKILNKILKKLPFGIHSKETPITEPVNNVAINTIEDIKRGKVCALPVIVDDVVIQDLKKKFIAFDIETTGFDSTNDRIIEVGAVLFENGEIIDEFTSLVNPKIVIPASATEVNHITNEMISSAPLEKELYPLLCNFLGDALEEKILICAHNANFDMKFLSATLERLGYNANIYYVDTLKLSRKLIHDTENHKQPTLAMHFGIINEQAHRAVSDAEVCGKILLKLINLIEEEQLAQQEKLKKYYPTDEELEICAYIQQCISAIDIDTNWLSFYKDSGNYVSVKYLYNVLKFKCSKSGNYIIINEAIVNNTSLVTKPCSKKEGITGDIRLYFESVFDLEFLSDYFIDEYKKRRKSALNFLKRKSQRYIDELRATLPLVGGLSDNEVQRLLLSAKERRELKNTTTEKPEKSKNNTIKKEIRNNPQNTKTTNKRAVVQLSNELVVINEYESIAEAERKTGINSKSIRETAKGNQKHAGGFIWKYTDDLKNKE